MLADVVERYHTQRLDASRLLGQSCWQGERHLVPQQDARTSSGTQSGAQTAIGKGRRDLTNDGSVRELVHHAEEPTRASLKRVSQISAPSTSEQSVTKLMPRIGHRFQGVSEN